ncbi:MAG: chromosome segregation and condensation protein, ScpB, partial [Deltaproteobacteria bacterium]|nr:chromosome segregation and condensation protein, ScpB [Deltaproteobacteria bacterium]
GVDSGGVLRTLLEKKLIKILGKKDVPGKPLVYGTSKHFLEMFGLKDLSGLPTLKDLAGLGPPPPQEQVLPLRNGKSDEEEAASREEETKSERMGEKNEPAGETSKDLG